jgi:hypothetical protein
MYIFLEVHYPKSGKEQHSNNMNQYIFANLLYFILFYQTYGPLP